MKVTCPNCKTTYNLPDDKARPGVKLRCTVCRQVFVLPPPENGESPRGDSDSVVSISIGKQDKPGRHKSSWLALLVLLLLGGGVAGIWHYTDWLEPVKALLVKTGQDAPASESEEERAARVVAMVNKLEIKNLRDFAVKNEKIGNLVVIEGKVVNGFDDARELIRVEASLQDEAGSTLVSKSQLAGATVSVFQLQVLSEAELEQGLSNKLDILTNNTNVPPGGSVPFMVVFYGAPEQARRYNVTVIDASKPQNEKK